MVTIADVARKVGVAPSVVSRLLNSDETLRIRPETRDRILTAVRDLGYVANSAARSLRMAKAGGLGLIVPDVTNPVHAEVLRGAEEEGDKAGYVLLLGNVDDLAAHELRYRELAASGRVDGFLLQPPNRQETGALNSFIDTAIPTVLMNSRLESHTGSVVLDDAAAVDIAVDHLVALGHTKIALLGGPASLDTAQRRLVAYKVAMERHRLAREARRIVNVEFEPEAAVKGVARLLSREQQPTAILAASIVPAVAVLTYIRGRGIRVPDDLSVIALHDTWFAPHACPPLTTVKMPLYELGKVAVRGLLDLLRGEQPRDILVDDPAPILTVRESTAPPAPSS